MSILSDWTGIFLAIAAVLGVVLAALRWVRPRYRERMQRVTQAFDSLFGRPAVIDTITGQVRVPELPGIGVRMYETEKHMDETKKHLGVLAEAVATIAESHVRLEDHEGRIVALERATVERIVNRVDSAAAWGAMQAASESTPHADIEER